MPVPARSASFGRTLLCAGRSLSRERAAVVKARRFRQTGKPLKPRGANPVGVDGGHGSRVPREYDCYARFLKPAGTGAMCRPRWCCWGPKRVAACRAAV
jgi:hypothetical protein